MKKPAKGKPQPKLQNRKAKGEPVPPARTVKGEFRVHSLGDLKPDPEQLRDHTPRGVGTIEDSLKRLGAGRSILIDEKGQVRAGNATMEAAAAAGFEHVLVVPVDGKTLVAVQRDNLTDAEWVDMALADNRAAEHSTWKATPLHAALTKFEIPPERYFYPEELEALTPPKERVRDVSFTATEKPEKAATEIECPACHARFVPEKALA